MKTYITPGISIVTYVMTHWVENTSDGPIDHYESGIDVGDVTIQIKPEVTHETWGDLW